MIGRNGTGPGEFSGPEGIAVDSSGTLYVADPGNNRIEKFSSDGHLLAVTGRLGPRPGAFISPTDIGVD